MPQISVIINIRNGASTLREAMDSVLAQSFRDWELIVWDDRSTDSSAAIVTAYNDSRIRYFLSPEDVSLGKARNDGDCEADGAVLDPSGSLGSRPVSVGGSRSRPNSSLVSRRARAHTRNR